MRTFSCVLLLEQIEMVRANLTYRFDISMYDGRLLTVEVRKPPSYTSNL